MSRLRRLLGSLSARIILACVLVEVVVLGLLVAGGARLMDSTLRAQAALRVEQSKPLLNAALAAPLAQEDIVTLQEILRESRSAQAIAYLVLLDDEGKPIASEGWDMHQRLPTADTELRLDLADGHFDVDMPIELAGQTYGRLHFGIALQELHATAQRLMAQNVAISVAAILASLGLLVAVGRWLTRPLKELTGAAQRIAEGGLDVRLRVASRDEVGTLTRAFNTMAGAIAERVQALQEAHALQQCYLEQSRAEHARLAALLSAMSIGILFVDEQDRIVYHNPALCRLLGIDVDAEVDGHAVQVLAALAAARGVARDCFASGQGQGRQSAELQLTDGTVLTRIAHPVRDEEGHTMGRLWILSDVTAERRTAQQLVYLAERDPLTGLYNRRSFQHELQRRLANAQRQGTQVALLLFDLDEFKLINDRYGHQAGDKVLVQVATEVSALVRRSEFFVRLGGDEFALICEAEGPEMLQALSDRIVQAIARLPVAFRGQSLRLTSSLGIALFPEHGDNPDELVARADAAMYQAKEAGKNGWQLYDRDRDGTDEKLARIGWNERLRRALDQQLLVPVFQGVFDTQSGQLQHYELLLRLRDEADPERLINPGQFIPHAERSGLIREIDRWVISNAIATLAQRAAVPAIAINISGRSFDDPGLPRHIENELRRHRVEPQRLLVELTETAAVGDLKDAQNLIAQLHGLGCRVCLDDFGSGFASFAYMKHLPADVLKIDGLFVRNLARDRNDLVFVRAIVDVAKGLNKTTIAEMVEDPETLALLKSVGVDHVQGYHFGRPQQLDECGAPPPPPRPALTQA
ncbi:EAL domain-containing protein [Azohydromonas lata]|uniref:EAL domain-containing protein n=1 Tax=Azohydromonas lata TaxID=45677 RepID=A0ABU5IQ44_9BURK|nr:EAL domain-containing protein [Azohydromonas lata]MDZ5461015.1 EAL domain-containing protein [Azohydromonas lata]